MSLMKLSQLGIDDIKRHEGLELTAYQDQRGVWTIGYGHTGKVDGVPIRAGMTITQQKAEELLQSRLAEFENAVNGNVNVPLNQDQFDVLFSLAYNIGPKGFKNSNVVNILNQGDYQAAANELLEYNQVKDKKLKRHLFSRGLFNRRVSEREKFLGGKVDAPMPSNYIPSFDNIFEQPDKSAEPFFDNAESVEPKADYRSQLASAFGIEPETSEMLDPNIEKMVRSIYDQTA